MKTSIGFRALALRGLLVVGLLGVVDNSWSYVPNPPTVTITAPAADASEDGPDTGTYTVTRTTENLSVPLTVYFQTPTGTATNGVDYQTLPGWVTIAPYSTATNITLTTILDANCDEGNETVELALATNANYWVGWPSNATVTILDAVSPSITTALTNQVACPGDSVTFAITATGTGPMTYAWKHNGATISGQTGSSLTLTNISSTNAGVYQVTMTGHCGSMSNSATLTVLTNLSVTGPLNTTNCLGSTVVFTVVASGSEPILYEWWFGTNVLAGETNSSLTISNVSSVNAGVYSIVVTGPCGSVTNEAMLTAAATVNAGEDRTIDASQTVILTGAFGGIVTNATWSGGTGTFYPNSTTTNAMYTPSESEVTNGTVTLTLTTDAPGGSCSAVSDSVTITITGYGYGGGVEEADFGCGGTWTRNAAGNWGTASLWDPASIPNEESAIAIFPTGATGWDVTLDADHTTVGALTFESEWNITDGGYNRDLILKFAAGCADLPTITVNNVLPPNEVIISATLSGNQGIIKAGGGQVTFARANDYAGETTISQGILKCGDDGCIPHGNSKGGVSVGESALLDINGFSEVTLNGLSGSGTVSDMSSSDGTYTLTVGDNNASSTFSGVIKDGYAYDPHQAHLALTKTGAGTLTLSGDCIYTGPTTIEAGTLLLTGAGVIRGTTAVNINGGTLRLGGHGRINDLADITIDGGTFDLDNYNEEVTVHPIGYLSPRFVKLQSGTINGSGTLSADESILESGTVNANISDWGHVTKRTSGTVTFNGQNFAGTAVEAGTLLINCPDPATPLSVYVSVCSGATLGGNGFVGGYIVLKNLDANDNYALPPGILAPGGVNSIGTLTTLWGPSLNDGITAMEINRSGSGSGGVLSNDKLVVELDPDDTLYYGGTLEVTLLAGSDPLEKGDTFQLFQATPPDYAGSFSQINLPALTSPLLHLDLHWNTSRLAVDGKISVVEYHYVDGSVTGGAHNGRSWDNAWEDTTDINWSEVGPGDIIYISGGPNGQSYSAFTVPDIADGTPGNPITIAASTEGEKNGIVTLATPIQVSGDYIVFQGNAYKDSGAGVYKCGIVFHCNTVTGGCYMCGAVRCTGIFPRFYYCYFDGDFSAAYGHSLVVYNATGFSATHCWWYQSSSEDQMQWQFTGTGATVALTNCCWQDNAKSGYWNPSGYPHRDITNPDPGSGGYDLFIVNCLYWFTPGKVTYQPQGDGFLMQNSSAVGDIRVINCAARGHQSFIKFGSGSGGQNSLYVLHTSIASPNGPQGDDLTMGVRSGSIQEINDIGYSTDPSYVDSTNPLGADGIPFTADDGFNLTPSSVGFIDTGSDIGITTDATGKTRDSNPDLGAYEY